MLGFPVIIIKLSKLNLHKIENWLAQRGVNFLFNCQSRALRGCLIAYGGRGLIFLEGTDSIEDQRFTLAHEIAHFLIEYWIPRQKAIQKLGVSITEVLDNRRAPSIPERVHSLLTGIRLGVYSELMMRNDSIEIAQSEIWSAEDQADKVAVALLAPLEDVIKDTELSGLKYDERLKSIKNVLTDRYGLPTAVASLYGTELLAAIDKGRSWSEIFQ